MLMRQVFKTEAARAKDYLNEALTQVNHPPTAFTSNRNGEALVAELAAH